MEPDSASFAATNVVPLLRYRDVAAAMDWLCAAFGFEQHFAVRGDAGNVLYAQLTSGAGMIMLGPVSDSEFDKLFKQPDEVGGSETQACYIAIDEIEAHYSRAKAHGAEIVFDLQDGPHGRMGYSCRDLEGHIWNFGTYDPWRDKRTPSARGDAGISQSRRRGLRREAIALSLCLAALAVSMSVLTERGILDLPFDRWAMSPWHSQKSRTETVVVESPASRDLVARVMEQEDELSRLEAAVSKARLELADMTAQRERIEYVFREASSKTKDAELTVEGVRQRLLAAEQSERDATLAVGEARQQLDAEKEARERAARLQQDTLTELEKERAARAVAEREKEEVALKLADALKLRETAERAVAAAQAAETDARRKLVVAEEALARSNPILTAAPADLTSALDPADAAQSSQAILDGTGASPAQVAARDTGTKVQAWNKAVGTDLPDGAITPDATKAKRVSQKNRKIKKVNVRIVKAAIARQAIPEAPLPSVSFPGTKY